MFNAAKDTLISRSAQVWASNLIARYGKVQHLKIDTANKSVEVTCLLEGETSPITVRIEDYRVETEGSKKFIHATKFSCSRPWLQIFLQDHGYRQRVELPPWAAAAL